MIARCRSPLPPCQELAHVAVVELWVLGDQLLVNSLSLSACGLGVHVDYHHSQLRQRLAQMRRRRAVTFALAIDDVVAQALFVVERHLLLVAEIPEEGGTAHLGEFDYMVPGVN